METHISPSRSEPPILQPGRNCWRIAEAERAAILIDAAAYFGRLEEALLRAQRSVVIIGWDFDGRILLRPDRGQDAQPLGPFLRALVEAKPELEIHILVWSVAVLHAPGSPVELLVGAEWQNHPRIHLKLDTEHPLYAAHHQKIVTVDDRLAFVGGMDLTVSRWDTPEHDPENPLRRDPDGKAFPPVHDVQMVVDGEAARAVVQVAHARWLYATGQHLPVVEAEHDVWPDAIAPHFRQCCVGIARTAPGWGEAPAYAEGAVLTVDTLKAAKRCIYIEAQYLTADFLGDILEEQLRRPAGPEIVVVLTRVSHGLAERWVMGHNRDHLLRRLRRADRHDRLRVYYPVVPSKTGGRDVLVHAKVAIVDNRLLRVGSSNLNNRSVALDTECDLAIEARSELVRERIADFRNALLAEHLGVSPEAVRDAVRQEDSLVRAIDRLNGGPRRLCPFEVDQSQAPARQVFGTALFDPKRPFRLLQPVVRLLSSLRAPAIRRRA
ncbi:phospholipase D-like domain-containing protein [Enterovirga aerilata]|uniref:Phospholipase D n=1 Tax=Enterovirga aerilata TaxID=2730920 RepID=A0A849HXQ5_9HYPH|nr:phospholipase D-like domain-containing protein [Enterovirga sp. DB1703]NNM72316.1 phospholipase [Enterovirga sp. DB1703]